MKESDLRSDFVKNYCGDGADGAVTVSGTVTLARDMFYSSLIVPSGAILNTNNWRIHCTGAVNVQADGIIQNNGNNASGSSGAVSSTNNSLRAALAGGGGTTTVGGNGNSDSTRALGGRGGAGGTGASGAGGTTSVHALHTSFGALKTPFYTAYGMLQGSVTPQPWFAGGSGGGGGGDGTTGGGGGGQGGGTVLINAYRTINDGIIRALGGNGASASSGNKGGGGAGGGGVIVINGALEYSGSGVLDVSPGSPGTGFGTGTAGNTGLSGQTFLRTWN